jgi:hypothetical protein
MIIYTDNVVSNELLAREDIDVIISPRTTKYKRMLMSLNDSKSENILYIDNDITPDSNNLIKFISKLDDNVDLAWGYIGVLLDHGFMPKLISIDKQISHKIIRPFLWKIDIGISVPGQVLFINATKFRRDLPQYDTVFDDLTIGICAKMYDYYTMRSALYLGYEKPSFSFHSLVRQRIRWSKGFYQSIVNNIHNGMLPYILVHGFTYHFLWLLIWVIIIFISKFSTSLGVLSWIIICICLCDKKHTLLGYSLVYSLIFPLIHVIWFLALIYNIILGIKKFTKK